MTLQAGQSFKGGSVRDADGRQIVVTTGGVSDTVGGAGTATTPAAGATIATIAAGSLPAGVYSVRVRLILSGTAETQLVNGQLKKGSTAITDLTSVAGLNSAEVDRVTLDGATALTVVAKALATTGAIYSATIMATRVEG